MIVSVKKWGNSMAVRIPAHIFSEAGLTQNEQLEMAVVNGKVVLQKLRRIYNLQELLSKVTPENRHELVDFGEPRGKELL